MQIELTGNKIYSNEFEYIARYPIDTYVIFDQIIILMLRNGINEQCNDNVLAIDFKGNLIWQIENLFGHGNCPFNFIKVDEDRLLHLYNWCGVIVKLDPLTGKVLNRIFSK